MFTTKLDGYTEVDLTDDEPPLVTEDEFVFTESPNMEMIHAAGLENKIVIAIVDLDLYGSIAQFMTEFKLKPTPLCLAWFKHMGETMEQCKERWMIHASMISASIWYAPAGFKRGTISLNPPPARIVK